jgi:hypothetical protein
MDWGRRRRPGHTHCVSLSVGIRLWAESSCRSAVAGASDIGYEGRSVPACSATM